MLPSSSTQARASAASELYRRQRQLRTVLEISHEANTVTKVLAMALLNQHGNQILVGLELESLAPSKIDFKDMLLLGGLRMRDAYYSHLRVHETVLALVCRHTPEKS